MAIRLIWQTQAAEITRMHAWIMETERILAGTWATTPQEVTNQAVGQRFDAWRTFLGQQLTTSPFMSETEHACLEHLLKVSASLRPRLIQCYDLPGLPRTNNEMEGYIRKLKTRYRRISGRKNWNAYLLRYGQSIAYYDCFEQTGVDALSMRTMFGQVAPSHWRRARTQGRAMHEDRVKIFRFRHKPTAFFQHLESRWANTLIGT